MSQEKIKTYKKIAQQIGKHYNYKSGNLSFINSKDGSINENVVLITLSNPVKKEYPNEISAAFLNTQEGLRIINFFMSKFYLFKTAEEEKNMFPADYKIYQDETYSYITSELPSNISALAKSFKVFNSFESIFLSEKTHYRYENLSDYIEDYYSLREAISECIKNKEPNELIEHFKKDFSFEKQIVQPLAKACLSLLGKTDYSYTSKITPFGEFVVLRFSSSGENVETGICLLISEKDNQVCVKKVTGYSQENGYNTLDLPNKVIEVINLMQTKPKTVAVKS